MDEQQYQANLEALLTARTEQLRKALTFIEELVVVLKSLRPDLVQKAVEEGFIADELNRPPMFGGKPGEPVPEVDPDLKTVWQMNRDLQARHPGQQVATGRGVYEHACKPGADIQAVGYRAAVLSMLIHLGSNPENPIKELRPWLKEDQLNDVVFRRQRRSRWNGWEWGSFEMDRLWMWMNLCGSAVGKPTTTLHSRSQSVYRLRVTTTCSETVTTHGLPVTNPELGLIRRHLPRNLQGVVGRRVTYLYSRQLDYDALCKSFLLTAFQSRRTNLTHTLNQPAARQGFGRTCSIDFDHLVQYLAAPP